MSKFEHVSASLSGLDAVEGLKWVVQNLDRVKFATSLGTEDQVLTHLIATNKFPVQLFTLDTGRLFQETYELLELTQSKYQIPIDIYFPDNLEVEQYVKSNGINGFYHSVENRKSCCGIRKVNPL